MCSFVARVRYRAQGEAAQLLSFDSKEELEKRLAELLALATVSGVTVFTPFESHEKVERVETTRHQELPQASN